MTTASSADGVKTPSSTSLTGFHFHIDENPIAGPTGPHLFRLSGDSSSKQSLLPDMQSTLPKSAIPSPLFNHATQEPSKESLSEQLASKLNDEIPAEVAEWSPEDVVMWMLKLGFDESIVEKFFINDISGSILLELQSEDLKELDIQSFGKRHRLLGCIRQLRNSTSLSSSQASDSEYSANTVERSQTDTPQTNAADVGLSYNDSCVSNGQKSSKEDKEAKRERRRRHRHKRRHEVAPEDSVSIVGIEQLLPKRHTCSKGENCAKWQKQQAKLARLANGLPIDSLGGSILLTGDPGNAEEAQTLARTPKSAITPSVVPSSDALGANQQRPTPKLSEESLHDVQPRDPQENVRNFLTFQCSNQLQAANDPPSPPVDSLQSPQRTSPETPKNNNTANLSENLRHLPKLHIPSTREPSSRIMSPNYSAQRTITPSILRRRQPFSAAQDSPAPNSALFSPGDFYRADPQYGHATPLSEVDVPVIEGEWGLPVARDASQSVPPDMRFGGHNQHMADPIQRPRSTKAENHRRNPSFQRAQNFGGLERLDEGRALQPIETPEDLEKTPRAAHCRNSPFAGNDGDKDDIIHSGWMKKRTTTRLMRHWQSRHCTLKGTQLALFEDEKDSWCDDSKALERIDVDDYAVACSSLPSNSKLTAAFKKTVLKRKDEDVDDAAFAFSLIPSPQGSTNGPGRKVFFTNGPKSHHFAVKSRDERIEWMRWLMLSRAFRKGMESGASVNVNGGTPI